MGKTVGIVGGGAAGMVAAIAAAKQGAEVTILEGNDRLGKKILATGNGKCNLGNLDMGPEKYYTGDNVFLQKCLERFGTEETIAFFKELGLLIKERNGYLYPVSEQAASVLDALRFGIARNSDRIKVYQETPIERIEVAKKQRQIRLWSGEKQFTFDRVVLACGGKAAPKTGSDGSGYKLTGMLGHSLIPVVPALVQLKGKEDWFKAVAGVRADAKLTGTFPDGTTISERGELQLTDYGISGIPVFQLSRQVNYVLRQVKEVEILIDFLPDYEREGFGERMLREREALTDGTVEEYFTGLLNKKLMALLIRLAGIKSTDRADKVSKERLLAVYELCRRLPVHIIGSNSFENAQVCAGGVPLLEITERMESKVAPGVFLAGELLDVDGRCGGYNLQWAWCSGYLAGTAAAAE